MASRAFWMPRPSAAEIAMARISDGKVKKTSMTRPSTLSTMPPK